MKKILFLMVLGVFFLSCSGDDVEPPTMGMGPTEYGEYLDKDSIHYYRCEEYENKYIVSKNKISNDERLWETEIENPGDEYIDIGYGETACFSDWRPGFFFSNENLLILQLQGSKYGSSPYVQKLYLCSISDGEVLKIIEPKYTIWYDSSMRWENGEFILSFHLIDGDSLPSKKGYIRFDKNGNILEEKQNISIGMTLDPIIISEREYAIAYDDYVKFLSLDIDYQDGLSISIKDYITKKYNQEKKPIVKIINTKLKGDYIIVSASITFYSGETKNEDIVINIGNKEIEEV